jgi:glycosyltransferase involved in cell wall biosynthesis
MPYVHEYRSKLFAVVRQHLFAFPLKKTIVVCEAIKEAYTSYFGIDAGKVLVIYGGTDLDRFRPTFNSSELKFRKDLKISENDKILGVIADLEPRKGHQYLLEAMPRIIEEVPNVKLLLIGNGSLKNKLQELCKELKIENHTIFVGTRNDIEKIIHLIDVSILPSLCGEGLSASLLESMAAEKPVVATDVGGTYELLEHGKNGFLVPPRDSSALAKAIITIIKNRKLAAEMGFEGRKVVKQNFDITIRAKREIELYEKFLANPL